MTPSAEMKYIDILEFVERGYLLEANRQFFHPLGLALTVQPNPDDPTSISLAGVQDFRDDPEGVVFAELSTMDIPKVSTLISERNEKIRHRLKRFGWGVQPIPSKIEPD